MGGAWLDLMGGAWLDLMGGAWLDPGARSSVYGAAGAQWRAHGLRVRSMNGESEKGERVGEWGIGKGREWGGMGNGIRRQSFEEEP